MSAALAVPVALPLLAAGVAVAAHRSLPAQRLVAVAGVLGALVASIVVLVDVDRHGPVVSHLGGWEPVVGIAYAADMTTALVLVVALVTVLAVLAFAIAQPETDEVAAFHPAFLVLVAGVSASLLTADLFHLFVGFELMLAASYVLITLSGGATQLRSATTYIVVNLVASALFLLVIAAVYASCGTVSFALLADRIGELPAGVRVALGLGLLGVFGIKAALFPLFNWLPDAYPAAPTAVTAVFAGLLTKVGVIVILRTQIELFPRDRPWTLLLVIATLTMLVGVLGAIAQDDMKRILSFHIVSQVGYMAFGIALGSRAAVAATIFFVVNQIPVKTSLFLVTGMVEHAAGSGALSRVGGLVRRMPGAAAMFGVAAISLAGLPPTGGFVAKLSLVEAGFDAQVWAVTGVALAVSLLTTFSMTKIWANAFLGPDEAPALGGRRDAGDGPRLRAPTGMTLATAGLVAVTLAVALLAGPLMERCLTGADELLGGTTVARVVSAP